MKILDNEFRKSLYKNLVEAGYTKDEAQTIIGNKYFVALKEKTQASIQALNDALNQSQFQAMTEVMKDIANDISEMDKLNKFLTKETNDK